MPRPPACAINTHRHGNFGFSTNPANSRYRFLGERRMLAPVHGRRLAESGCSSDNRVRCMENWEIRRLYVVEADAKSNTNKRIPTPILFLGSEGWFITPSDH